MKTVVKIKFGSHLYGTNTPTSDLDYKSVHIPDVRDIVLGTAAKSLKLGTNRSKSEGEKNTPEDIDNESYSLKYFFELLADGQTVAIDMLFAPEPEEKSDLWKHIQKNAQSFISNRSAAFVGYCRTQANKYGIKGSRVAAARDAAAFFKSEYELRGALDKVGSIPHGMQHLINTHSEHIAIVNHEDVRDVRRNETYFECCNKLVPFTASIKLAYDIFKKVHDGYGARAKMAESNEGIDWKALSHAVRVGQEALELMQTGKVTFPLPNASHILNIKQGKLSYDIVAKEIEELLQQVTEAEKVSILPDKPNKKLIDNIVYGAYLKEISTMLF